MNPDTITEIVLDQMSQTPDERFRTVMGALVRHLHDFAREVSLTPEEWLEGIKFLTAVGQTCTPIRQEFILLSDVLGVSALVNVMHDARAVDSPTEASNLGPFYRVDAPDLPSGASISGRCEPNLVVFGQVADAAGRAVPGAKVEIWQPDAAGSYDLQIADGSEMNLRGCLRADGEGRYWVRTVAPIGYMVPMDGPVGDLIRGQARHGYRPAHIHFLVSAEGYREVVTAIYLSHDPHIESDTVFGVSDPLVVTPRESDPASPVQGLPSIRFDFRLSRADGAGSGRVGADPSQILPR
ncbi:MAG TPA: dioxygenase [Stellaceae bacterium]|nr:dioxygenase [Stellaceae bacterium]